MLLDLNFRFEYFYLNNTNEELEPWYIDNEGKITTTTGKDTYGVKPVITIKSNIDYISGDGTKDNPYRIEKENGLEIVDQHIADERYIYEKLKKSKSIDYYSIICIYK